MNPRTAAIPAVALLILAAPALGGDLGDRIRIGGITYVAQESAENARWPEPVSATLLGEQLARVTCRMRGADTCRAAAVAASGLAIGTPIHAVTGYRPEFRIAVRRDGELWLYEAWENRRATRGGDLYDLENKVVAIEVIREDRTSTAALQRSFSHPDGARIDDPSAIAQLVGLVLTAPTVTRDDRRPGNPKIRYWLTFRFRDGTATGRAYDPDSGQLARALLLPAEFRTLVEDAVNFIGRK
jgi:hypothetical protein